MIVLNAAIIADIVDTVDDALQPSTAPLVNSRNSLDLTQNKQFFPAKSITENADSSYSDRVDNILALCDRKFKQCGRPPPKKQEFLSSPFKKDDISTQQESLVCDFLSHLDPASIMNLTNLE